MIPAILHGKLSSVLRRKEDVLTSNVFGLLFFLAPEDGLLPWLRTAQRLDGTRLAVAPPGGHLFWPKLVHPRGGKCEPDVVLLPEAGEGVLFIECKLYSGLSGRPTPEEDEEVRGQLGNQWLALRHGWQVDDAEEGQHRAAGAIVYLTRDWVMPGADIAATIREIESKTGDAGLTDALYWLSWRSLPSVLDRNPATSPEGQRIQASLTALLDAMDLACLRGCEQARPVRVRWRYGYGLRTPAVTPIPWTYGDADI